MAATPAKIQPSPMVLMMFEQYAKDLLGDIADRYDLPMAELLDYYKLDAWGDDGNRDPEHALMQPDASVTLQETAKLTHSHLPVRWRVPGCAFCEKHGNVMESYSPLVK